MFNVGIDIAKRGHVAAVVDQNGKLLVESFKFSNTAEGSARGCLLKIRSCIHKRNILITFKKSSEVPRR